MPIALPLGYHYGSPIPTHSWQVLKAAIGFGLQDKSLIQSCDIQSMDYRSTFHALLRGHSKF